MNDADDLQRVWNAYTLRLDERRATDAALVPNLQRASAAGMLWPVHLTLWLEVAMNVLALVLLGSFAANAFGRWDLFVPAVILFAAAWLTVFFAARQLVLLARVDFSAPVVAVQAGIEQLRLLRARTIYWSFASAPLVWVPLLIVGLSLLGIDAYALGVPFLLANLAFGIAVLVVGGALARRATASSPLADALTGRSLRLARERLAAVARFAAGDAPAPGA